MNFTFKNVVAVAVLFVAGALFSNQAQAGCWYPGKKLIRCVRSASSVTACNGRTTRIAPLRRAVRTVRCTAGCSK